MVAAALSTTATQRTTVCPAAVPKPVHLFRCPPSVLAQKSSPARLTVANAAEAVAAVAEAPAATSDLRKYETLIVLKPTLTDEERDKELARFETFLIAEECQELKAMVRGRHRMAYPVKGNWEGIYVLFSFLAKPSTASQVQILLSNPPAGSEDNILRHMTLSAEGGLQMSNKHTATICDGEGCKHEYCNVQFEEKVRGSKL